MFLSLVGLGAGVTLGVWAVRKLERTRTRLTPGHLGGTAAARTGVLRERLAAAVAEGRRAAADKEAELRAVYGGVRQPDTPDPVARRESVDPDAR